MADLTDQPLSADVHPDAVYALLVGRAPETWQQPHMKDAVQRLIEGIAVEVTEITSDPPPPAVRQLAVWAVTLGVASSLESSLHPEQQLGDEGRASDLRVKYLAALSMLRANPAVASTGRRALFSYPPPQAWPEPNAVRYRPPYGGWY